MRTPIANRQQLAAMRDAIRSEQAAREASNHRRIMLCAGAGCIASGALQVKVALEKELELRSIADKVTIVETGCLGPCSAGPVLKIGEVFYEKLKPQDAPEIVAEHLIRRRVVHRLTHKRGRRQARGQHVGNRLLQAAEQDRPAQLRLDRPAADRGLHCRRRLRGSGQGARDGRSGSGHRDDPHQRASRPRRRRLSHGAEMAIHASGPRRREVRGLQRRRGGPRGVHGP